MTHIPILLLCGLVFVIAGRSLYQRRAAGQVFGDQPTWLYVLGVVLALGLILIWVVTQKSASATN